MIRLLTSGLLASCCFAGIWPEQWWEYKRLSVSPVTVDDRLIWEEYGLQEAETAEYQDAAGRFRATAWRLKDSTSAYAVYQWQRPAGWKKSAAESLAVAGGSSIYFAYGNYVFRIEGRTPDEDRRKILYVQLPRLEVSPLPNLDGYFPAGDRVEGSDRYVIGPVSLEKFEPRIPPSLAAFHLGAEAHLARYRMGSGEVPMLVLSYPTPNMARARLAEFEKLPGVLTKRTGPLLAVLVQPPDPDAAQRLLARVNYQASVSWHEQANRPEENPGELILGIARLVGVLIVGTILAGLAFFGVRSAGRRWLGWPESPQSMLTLDIDDKTRS